MNEEEAREIGILILDGFEELLAAKGIRMPSDDREAREEEACLYGEEYCELEEVGGSVVMGHDCAANQNTSGCATRK